MNLRSRLNAFADAPRDEALIANINILEEYDGKELKDGLYYVCSGQLSQLSEYYSRAKLQNAILEIIQDSSFTTLELEDFVTKIITEYCLDEFFVSRFTLAGLEENVYLLRANIEMPDHFDIPINLIYKLLTRARKRVHKKWINICQIPMLQEPIANFFQKYQDPGNHYKKSSLDRFKYDAQIYLTDKEVKTICPESAQVAWHIYTEFSGLVFGKDYMFLRAHGDFAAFTSRKQFRAMQRVFLNIVGPTPKNARKN